MKLTHSVRYDAPVAVVSAMVMDPAFREKSALAQGSTSVDVSVDGPAVQVDMHQPNTDIPGFARKLVGESMHVVQAETWTAPEAADFSITMPGMPGGITGTRTLVADGGGTLDSFTGEATAKIPLIGAKLETLISTKLKDGWDTEHGVGVAWLEGDR